jgi:cellulose synthase/poly-beta-1,6-N-acetylglucosamine synthase-like glycosyltransferase
MSRFGGRLQTAAWWLAAASLVGYATKLLRTAAGLDQLGDGHGVEQPIVTVIVPARNEEANIQVSLRSLNAQDYPKYLYEIIVVNDRSTDNTRALAEAMRTEIPRIRVLTVDSVPPGVAPKKNALTCAIREALGEIIMTTDADCIHEPGWISGMVRYFEPEIGVVTGHTKYRDAETLFESIQSLDYLSHRTISAGAIGAGEIISGTGSNLAYRKQVWDEIGGFGESDELVSGDDDLFLHRVSRLTEWGITAATNPDTFVTTDPVPSIGGFINQRARWASKLTGYNVGLKPFLLTSGTLFLLVSITLPLTLLMPRRMARWVPILIVKTGVDYLVMKRGAKLFKQEKLLKYFLLADILNPYYVLTSVIRGLFGSFSWKGSTYRRKA